MTTSSARLVPFSPSLLRSYNAAVGQVAQERVFLASVRPFTLEETSAFVTHLFQEGGVLILAIREEDTVVGWCDVVPRPFEGMRHVGTLGMGVVKEHRGQGIGRRLLERVLPDAAARGFRKIELEVFATNIAAIGLYERTGFEREGVRRNGRYLDGAYDDIVLMGRYLT